MSVHLTEVRSLDIIATALADIQLEPWYLLGIEIVVSASFLIPTKHTTKSRQMVLRTTERAASIPLALFVQVTNQR